MKSILTIFSVATAVTLIFLLAYRVQWSSSAVPPGDGGSTNLPTCTFSRLGQQAYSVGYIWRCVHDSYGYRWIVVG